MQTSNGCKKGKDMIDRNTKPADQEPKINEKNPAEDKSDDTAAREMSPEPPPPKRILVLDDDPAIRKLFSKMLKIAGYEVALAANGKEGLQLFTESPFDLVITDIVMPAMSGHDFMIKLKKDFPDVKIIAVSGNEFFGPEVDLFIAETLGAAKVFSKPFEVDEVLDAVKTLLQ